MLTLPPSTRIFIARETIDMRKSFSGLSVVVRSVLQQDPMSGYLFVFLGRTRTIVKALYWDRGGYCVWSRSDSSGGASRRCRSRAQGSASSSTGLT